MSTNPTPALPQLPDGMRILSHQDMRAVRDAAHAAARRHGVRGHLAEEIAFDALAAAGVFNQPPEPEPDTCSAMFLPHQREEFTPDMLGVWQQCADEPGHVDDHDSGNTNWVDGMPGTLPARPADREA
ncbi:hypothetical protein ACFY0R_37835 [Streptomyces sp. NPDC001633]|uniref:hypothetical protein n=1 Tax=Streptomyces sp. NPDC001633 TaxID=3364595 RepID=UPI0036CE38A9